MDKKHGLVRVSAVSPRLALADPEKNVQLSLEAYRETAIDKPDLVVFPELGITGYSCADLFQQDILLQQAETALRQLVENTCQEDTVFAVGLPVAKENRLFNCAAVFQAGRILGLVPKSIIPNYREFYEQRWFASGDEARQNTAIIAGQEVPFGSDLIFTAENHPDFSFGVEICEDLWAPAPPSTKLALDGAQILLNLSASNELVGKTEFRRQTILSHSGRCLAAYVYSSAGPLESTVDLVCGGHCLIAEKGEFIAESSRFKRQSHSVTADIDIELLTRERRRSHAFHSQTGKSPWPVPRRIMFSAREEKNREAKDIKRRVQPLPFVPGDPRERQNNCSEITSIQSSALATRLDKTGIQHAVIGLSGGLDSTLALLITIEAFKLVKLPFKNIHCFTLPGYGTSEHTLENVQILTRQTGVKLERIDIRPACEQHFKDISYDSSSLDVVYENTQARERTQILMDKANMLGALVIGTGDLSELALGWCTYCGDHMSMYAVNAGVPKTMIIYLIKYLAEAAENQELGSILNQILETPISPELLPPDQQGEIKQKTEEEIGPYELHDFFLYNFLHYGFSPEKTLFLATTAFAGKYEIKELRRWLAEFIRRFFSQQFKRSCLPDGPKVTTVSLSPRGDWRMPSDIDARAWLADLPPEK